MHTSLVAARNHAAMDMKSTSEVHFGQYLDLVREFCPRVQELVAYNHEGHCVWASDIDQSARQSLQSQIDEHRARGGQAASAAKLHCLGDDRYLEIIDLKNDDDEMILTLGICLAGEDGQAPEALAAQQAIFLLNQFLATEYEQTIALAGQEDELNFMTDELTQRYEELNLIYKAEDQAMNIFHGRELLRQLVTNTSNYLSVDVIYLILPDENIAIYKFKNDQPAPEFEQFFEFLRDSIYPLLQAENTSLVLNHIEDAKRLGINQALPFKLVASIVVNAEHEVIGSLAIASQADVLDFTNSDRNLIEVMAKKASKITQSNFDQLTGLENNHSFELIIKDLLKQSWATGVTHAIANIDINRMAVINDISGRKAGDMLLKKVSQKFAGMVRSRDVVARIGSDKFGVLLENCDLATAEVVLRKIADEVSKIDLNWQGETYEVSVSIGIAPINSQSKTVTSVLNAAETARNLSKEHGRNTIHVLEMDDSDLLFRKNQIKWVGRIQSALRDDQFQLYAQLIHPMKTENIIPHFEILIRLKGKDGSIVEPGKFLPAAESFYLMSSIDYWVIDRAFMELAQHSQALESPRCQISINLSGQSLSDPINLTNYVREKLIHYSLDGSAICFEITESAAIANIDDARQFIEQVRTLGCSFSLDDFGTGLSSFAYLKNLRVDYLKIDGSFVREIVSDPVCASIVSAITQVGHSMNLKIIAEFVENDAMNRKLAEIGVDFSQGSRFGKPLPFAEQLDQLLPSADYARVENV